MGSGTVRSILGGRGGGGERDLAGDERRAGEGEVVGGLGEGGEEEGRLAGHGDLLLLLRYHFLGVTGMALLFIWANSSGLLICLLAGLLLITCVGFRLSSRPLWLAC